MTHPHPPSKERNLKIILNGKSQYHIEGQNPSHNLLDIIITITYKFKRVLCKILEMR